MVQRELVFPVTADRLWEALTEPDSLAGWFGAQVEWDLTPGGAARFVGAEEGDRHGLVDDVAPGRRLRFRWWPDDDEEAVSEVSYELDPEDEGTRLTVIERPVAPSAFRGASACAVTWDGWDDRLTGLWLSARAGGPRPALVAVAVSA